MEVMMRASVVVVGEMNCDGVECKCEGYGRLPRAVL
jgi:hypothetical protein